MPIYLVVQCPYCGKYQATAAKVLQCKFCHKSRQITGKKGVTVNIAARTGDPMEAALVVQKMNIKR